MPTVLRRGPYRFFLYSSDRAEPPHVHVERDSHRAKLWLAPVRLAENADFSAVEVNRVRRLTVENRTTLLRSWHDHFAD
ncbi:MAG TPA: DUF4160 domain-containing protein [Gemmatimonadaceae bacterium]|nr:DUF4160 domain-containing protein [Gemmatimonadaceae bacterium]